VPIACTLNVEDAHDRIGEWRAFFSEHTDRVESNGPTSGAVRLLGRAESVAVAADLAQREVGCCAFFAFALQLRDGRWWLEVSVPPDAAPTLSDFLSMA
jgi:hypothetical protein